MPLSLVTLRLLDRLSRERAQQLLLKLLSMATGWRIFFLACSEVKSLVKESYLYNLYRTSGSRVLSLMLGQRSGTNLWERKRFPLFMIHHYMEVTLRLLCLHALYHKPCWPIHLPRLLHSC